MRGRLFIRVFLWYWLGSITLLMVLVAMFVTAPPDIVTWRFIGRTAMRSLGAEVADIYERRGVQAATASLAEISRDGQFRVWLYGPGGSVIAGPTALEGTRDLITQALASGDAERMAQGGTLLLARGAVGRSGTRYVIAWEAPRPLRASARQSPLRSSIRMGVLLLTSGFVCLLLSWQITRPISALRSAARRLADGDLSVRVGRMPELRRTDELGDLAREFDQMAARVQTAIDAQRQLLGDISHELRSPLARLSLGLDLARRRLGDDVPEHQRIAREIRRLDDLIEQLLTVAQLQDPSGQPALMELDIGELVCDVADDARFEAEQLGRRVVIEHTCDVQVPGNRRLLRSAIDNVVRNAVHYAPVGTTVSIAVEKPAAGSGRVTISVRDRGPGVPAEALDRLFDPFFRVDDARDRATGGAGLGLAITRQAVAAHGGRAHARLHPEGGLVVSLEL